MFGFDLLFIFQNINQHTFFDVSENTENTLCRWLTFIT